MRNKDLTNGEDIPLEILVQRAKEGDRTAFESLFRLTHAQVYNFILSLGLSRDEADDVCQQTYIKAWTSLPGLKCLTCFISWLHRIARNQAKDHFKARSRRPTVIEMDDSTGVSGRETQPEYAAEASVISKAILEGLESLPEDQRLPIVMHHIEGLAISDISQALGVRMGTVLSRMARGRASLARRLCSFIEPEYDKKGVSDVLSDKS